MSVIVPIDSDKIVEILFDNSEQLSNDIYVDLMALMKRYHDEGDNEDQIKAYLNSKKNLMDAKVLERIKKYIAKEPCISRETFYIILAFSFFVLLIGSMMYWMYVGHRYGPVSLIPPPSTRPS
jgi:hypothetical protein